VAHAAKTVELEYKINYRTVFEFVICESSVIKERKQYCESAPKAVFVLNHRNERAMVIGGHSTVLVVFCLDAWSVKKVIKLPEDVSGVRHIEFVPQLFDAGANKVSKHVSLFCNST
jgi:hypothetical protein